MQHLSVLRREKYGKDRRSPKGLLVRAAGKFYTHDIIARHLVEAVLRWDVPDGLRGIRVVEPFCGDGRLVCLFLESAARRDEWSRLEWDVELWDCDAEALAVAKQGIARVAAEAGINVRVKAVHGDAFTLAPKRAGRFHICITNPPWDILKPDRRELDELDRDDAGEYVQLLKKQDEVLGKLYPLSMPLRRYSGWGTNLARCGVEAALRLTAPGGVCAFVSPASLLADEMSERLRRWVFDQHMVRDIAYYAAEARLFEGVDQPSITLVASPGGKTTEVPSLSTYRKDRHRRSVSLGADDWRWFEECGYVIPLGFEMGLMKAQSRWRDLPTFADLEGDGPRSLWAGRELDETGHQEFLGRQGEYLFVKGRMIERFGLVEPPTQFVKEDGPRIPASARHARIAWRDVSRPSQKRRMHAAIILKGWVTGNSLSVAYFRDDDLERLKALLAVMNSLVFEAQVRSRLATAHISLGTVRQARVPSLTDRRVVRHLAKLVDRRMTAKRDASVALEVRVAQLYGLSREEFGALLGPFEKLTDGEVKALLSERRWRSPLDIPINGRGGEVAEGGERSIPNHFTPSLSDLDLMIVRSVPPGGNWKDVPEYVPSQRLRQIRESFAAGEGSRSTYYGRLRPDAPSYTINTYFYRPGNGCHIHYDSGQNRVLSQREAARLQSFPDSFVFKGGQGAVATQIGNAVPPLLAYQIAKTLPYRGQFVDLFSGAGGLALGFVWAGWESLVANDIDEAALETYGANIHEDTIPGDIRDPAVFEAILEQCKRGRRGKRSTPLIVLGGPPCQGFSTAGNRRSMDDQRNWLFRQYKAILEALNPTGFIFENVSGLLNMEGGRVFEMIREELSSVTKTLSVWKLRSEEYAIPQRRTRVILFGDSRARQKHAPPPPVTQLGTQGALFGDLHPAITVREALSDLPPLKPGEDGSHRAYLCEPVSAYQELMRSRISPEEYLRSLQVL